MIDSSYEITDLLADYLASQQVNTGLLLVENERQAQLVTKKTNIFGNQVAYYLPNYDTLPYENSTPSPRIVSQRIKSLSHATKGDNGWLVTSVKTALSPLPPRIFFEHTHRLQPGDHLTPDDFCKQLIQMNYEPVSCVTQPGTFAQRGGLLDFYPNGHPLPYRVDWFDQTIDSIKIFDPISQHSKKECDTIDLFPGKEWLPFNEASLLNRLENWFANAQEHPLYQAISQNKPYLGLHHFLPILHRKHQYLHHYLKQNTPILWYTDLSDAIPKIHNELKQYFNQWQLPIEMTHLDHLRDTPATEILTEASLSRRPSLPTPNKASSNLIFSAPHQDALNDQHQRLLDAAIPHQVITHLNKHQSQTNSLCLTPFHRPFYSQTLSAAIIFASNPRQIRQQSTKTQAEQVTLPLETLQPNDLVIHQTHGLGQYKGLKTLHYGQTTTECIVLAYANQDTLFVSVDEMHQLSRYQCPRGIKPPPLHTLNGKQWDKQKKQVQQKIHDVAAELLVVYATREKNTRPAMMIPQKNYQIFSNEFPFQLTIDQEKAITSVMDDLTSDTPMDRLICGDVGFGKTEIAIRAAWLAIQNHQQVIVLAPTTVLAQQHAETFSRRFASWPIECATISRLTQGKKKQTLIDQINSGKIDLIIGTHALLNPSLSFPQLGLVIIDEEQKFGVRQKETIKAWRAQCDLLTLSATPLPRTLQYALSDMRDLSLITSPPEHRLPVKTQVQDYQDTCLREGILREINRGGQIYICCNQLATLPHYANLVKQWIPDIKVGIAHGQMPAHKLKQIMTDFANESLSVLVCSSIIESGLDHPKANTLFVIDADRFGLTQLHQLRGRIGRSHYQAYAYFLVQDQATLTRDASERLLALAKHSDLGDGFKLAIEDMELRGVGELFGSAQSGHIKTIGFALYSQYLQEAMLTLKGEKPTTSTDIDVYFSTLIPEDYLTDIPLRLSFYQQLAAAQTIDQLAAIQEDLADRLGPLPLPALCLLYKTQLRLLSGSRKISRIHMTDQYAKLTLEETNHFTLPATPALTILDPYTLKFTFVESNPLKQLTELIHFIERWQDDSTNSC